MLAALVQLISIAIRVAHGAQVFLNIRRIEQSRERLSNELPCRDWGSRDFGKQCFARFDYVNDVFPIGASTQVGCPVMHGLKFGGQEMRSIQD